MRFIKAVSFICFISGFTIADVLLWPYFSTMPLNVENAYHQYFMISWILGSVLLGSTFRDFRLSIASLCYFLFNLEDTFYYLIKQHSLPLVYNEIYAFGVSDPKLGIMIPWNVLGLLIMIFPYVVWHERYVVKDYSTAY